MDFRKFRGRLRESPLAMAFAFSFLVHATLYTGWKLGNTLGWWKGSSAWVERLKKPKPHDPKLAAQAREPVKLPKEIPLTFIEVDPATATLEPPKDAKHYATQNSKAANPDPVLDTQKPKIDGKQDKVLRLADVPKPQPLQPAPPPPEKEAPKPLEATPKAKPLEPAGNLAQTKPEELRKPTPDKDELAVNGSKPGPKERVRTLAAAREQNKTLVGEKMKQDGGAKHRGALATDAKITPFSKYDAVFIAAVQQCWYNELDKSSFSQRSGKVVLEFNLNYDGRITDMKMDSCDVGVILGRLCEHAVLDPAPYAKWPNEMRAMIGGNKRLVTFTFYYY